MASSVARPLDRQPSGRDPGLAARVAAQLLHCLPCCHVELARLSGPSYKPRGKRSMLPSRRGVCPDHKYEIDQKVLGEGAFGCVRRAHRRSSQKECVVKVMRKADIPKSMSHSNEFEIQSHLDHPNICSLYGVFETPKEVHMVMEVCQGGDLSDALVQSGHLSEPDARHLMLQLLRAVCYMHGRHIVHRDLKPENCILKYQGVQLAQNHIKVVDFGFARPFVPGARCLGTKCGTPEFIAPEILRQDFYDEKCDLWSAGVVLHALLSGAHPFGGSTDSVLLDNVEQGIVTFEDPIWQRVSGSAKLAVRSLCCLDPARRCSASGALRGEWLREGRLDQQTVEAARAQGPTLLQRLRSFEHACRFKKAAAHLVAHHLPDEALTPLRQAFEAADRDGRGVVSKEELRAAVIGEVDDASFQKWFADVDTEGDGKVEWTQFLSMLACKSQLSCRQACSEAFSVIDSNGDGRITLAELQDMLRHFGFEDSAIRGAKACKDLTSADTNCDGYIDFDEFVALMAGSGTRDPLRNTRAD